MPKTAQYDLAGYGQQGYSTRMDELGLLPGMSPDTPPAEAQPHPGSRNWMAPVGLAAAGLVGYGLLRGKGGAGKPGLWQRIKGYFGPKKPQYDKWNWDMEMLGRDASKRYQSMAYPGQTVGGGAGTMEEVLSKAGSADPVKLAFIIQQLGTIARED